MTAQAHSAAYHRFAILLGVANASDIVTWADSEIAQNDNPPSALIDISMGGDLPASQLASCLAQLCNNPNDSSPLKLALGRVASAIRCGALTTDSAVLRVYELLRTTNFLYDDDFVVFTKLEDDLSLVQDGIFGPDKLDEVHEELLDTLDALAASAQDSG